MEKKAVTMEMLDTADNAIREKGYQVEIYDVKVHMGKTLPSKGGQFTSRRADVELSAIVSVNAAADDSKAKLNNIVLALTKVCGANMDDVMSTME